MLYLVFLTHMRATGGRKDRKEVQDEDQAWCKGNQALMVSLHGLSSALV